MAGFLAAIAGGALEGLGTGIVNEARQLREERLKELEYNRGLEKESRDRDFQVSERLASQKFQLDNRQGELIDLGGGKMGQRVGNKVEPITGPDGQPVIRPTSSEYSQRAKAVEEYGIDPNSAEGRMFILTGKLPEKAGGNPKYGMNPVFLQKEDGTVTVGQLTDTGELNPSKMPDGLQVLSPYEKSRQNAKGKAEGTISGEAAAAIATAEKTAADIDKKIASLKSDPALPRILGPMDSRTPNITTEAARVQAKVNQLKGDAFLEARQMLKGGGAITDYEGIKAEQAIARLDQAQSEEDFKAALDDFNAAVKSGSEKIKMMAMQGEGVPAAAQGRTASGITFTVEDE